MNTRHAIQPSDLPAVLSIALSTTHTRFIVGTSEGLRVLRLDNCLTTYQPQLSSIGTALVDGGIGIAEALDDRYLAYCAGGRIPQGSIDHFVWHDQTTGNDLIKHDLHEPVLGIKISRNRAAVTLIGRTILFQHQRLPTGEIGPGYAEILHKTAANPYGLCILRPEILVIPAQSVGQVQLVPLPVGSKRVFRAHNTQLRALALSDDGALLATASVQGTLIRVFDTRTMDQVAEFRRGVDHAVIYSLAFSPGNRWLACSSDKGTLHMFDLRPNTASIDMPVHRSSTSGSRPASAAFSAAQPSPPASVQYQGSVQEYYGLLPPPPAVTSSASHSAAGSALNALRQSPFAPRALRDVRSVASAPFHMGDEPVHWQGGSSHTWTIAPNGIRRRVRREVPPMANEPRGRPPKGVLTFATGEDEDAGALLYCIGGGSDARWERFRLSRNTSNGTHEWSLLQAGYRKYLTRQFPEE